jgi:putative SOS response-associated peptidase YedK
MCSRFELNTTPRELARQFRLSTAPAMPNRAEVRPTDTALVINDATRSCLRVWGIPAPWDGKPVFNARAETLLEKSIFQPYLKKRCIIPATSFPEWRKDGKTRYRNDISLGAWDNGTEPIMAFAALMNDTYSTIITCDASPRMAPVHGRMPVILSAGGIDNWLSDASIDACMDILVPYEGNDLQIIEEVPPPPKQPDLFT